MRGVPKTPGAHCGRAFLGNLTNQRGTQKRTADWTRSMSKVPGARGQSQLFSSPYPSRADQSGKAQTRGWHIHRPLCMRPTNAGQHLCHRVLPVACSGLSGTGTLACALCMECISPGTGRSACATHDLFMRALSTASGFLPSNRRAPRFPDACALARIPGASAGLCATCSMPLPRRGFSRILKVTKARGGTAWQFISHQSRSGGFTTS